MAKLPPRFNATVMPLVLTMFMTFIVSAIATWRAIGLSGDAVGTWLASWLVSWAIAFPVMLLVMPLTRKVVALFVEPPPGAPRP